MKKDKTKKVTEPSAAEVVAAGGVEVDAVICKISTLCDGGTRISVDLPELEPTMFALLYALRNKRIKMILK